MKAFRSDWMVLLLIVAGCGAGESSEAGSRYPTVGTIATEPSLSLEGDHAGEPFAGIVGVHRLPDGNTVVADAQQLRWFDGAGRLIRSAGSHNAERGIRRDILWMRGYRGDSLIAWYAAAAEFSVWDASGSLARSFPFHTDIPPGFILPDSPSPDGSVLAMTGPAHIQEWSDGSWSTLGLVTFTAEGDPAEKPGTALRYPCRGPVERGCGDDFSAYHGAWTATGRGAYIARPDRADIRWVVADSAWIIKGPDGWARDRADGIPTYSRLLVDSGSNLWAQSGDGSRAAVFDRRNILAGTIDVPAGLQLHQVGLDFVVGVIENADGVGRVQIHTLRRELSFDRR